MLHESCRIIYKALSFILLKYQRVDYEIVIIIRIESFFKVDDIFIGRNLAAGIRLYFQKKFPNFMEYSLTPVTFNAGSCGFNFPKTILFSSRSQHSLLDVVGKSERTSLSKQTKQTFLNLRLSTSVSYWSIEFLDDLD